MTQPNALFLADILEDGGKPADIAEKAAAELRRLARVEEQRDELLEALKELLNAESSYPWSGWSESELAAIDKARAAIKAAEEAA